MNKNIKIPKFTSKKDEADFWDKHDFSDFLNQSKPVSLKVNLNVPKNEVLTIRLQPQLKQQMNQLATQMGIQTSTLARIWLLEKLNAITNKQV